MVSRQREWQKRQIAKGLCSLCAQPRHHYATFCDKHQLKHQELERKRRASIKRLKDSQKETL